MPPKKSRVTVKGKSGTLNTKQSRQKQAKDRGIKGRAKTLAKVKLNDMVKKVKKTYKMTSKNGISPKLIEMALNNIKNFTYNSNVTQLSKNIHDLLLTKLYGLKSTAVVRQILEVPANPGTVQGPTLYGCGGDPLPPVNSTASWFFPPEVRDKMIDSGLVYCWMSLVPCTFKQGSNSGLGINHEMEHAVPCAGQAFANLLAQRRTLKDGAETKYRKHHIILFDIIRSIPGIDNTGAKKYVFLIMKMMRRQQVLLGLPSISVINQKKCQLNLLQMGIDSNFHIRLSTDQGILERIIEAVDSDNKHGLTEKDGKIGFAPCGWAGVHHSKSAFSSKAKLEKLYSTGYPGQPRKISEAADKALIYKNETKQGKKEILERQCGKVCEEYNKMADRNLSDLILASSILVLTVIMNSTYKDLGVETDEIPELFKWCDKAKEILQTSLVKLDDIESQRFIIEQSEELAILSGNNTTKAFLNFEDITISDFNVGVDLSAAVTSQPDQSLAGAAPAPPEEEDKESEVNMDKESEVNMDKESEVEMDKGSEVNMDKESEVNMDKESEVNMDKESEVEMDKESDDEDDTSYAAAPNLTVREAVPSAFGDTPDLSSTPMARTDNVNIAGQGGGALPDIKKAVGEVSEMRSDPDDVPSEPKDEINKMNPPPEEDDMKAGVAQPEVESLSPPENTNREVWTPTNDDLNDILTKLNNIFKNPHATEDNPNLGVEENINLMFDYFEGGGGDDLNPDFFDKLQQNINLLDDTELYSINNTDLGIAMVKKTRKKRKTHKKKKRKTTRRKQNTTYKEAKTKKKKRKKNRTVKKDSLYNRILKRLGF